MHERPVHHPPEIGARRGRWTSPGRVDAGLPRNCCGNGLHDLLHADAALAGLLRPREAHLRLARSTLWQSTATDFACFGGFRADLILTLIATGRNHGAP